MSKFFYSRYQDIKILKSKSWSLRKVDHGFIGSDLRLDHSKSKIMISELKNIFNLDICFIPEMKHGNDCFICQTNSDLDFLQSQTKGDYPYDSKLQVDSIIFKKNLSEKKTMYALDTADCLPILIETENFFALIHAGWKGLSNSIIALTVKRLEQYQEKICNLIIGPAAGKGAYEFGVDLLTEFPENEVSFDQIDKSRCYLNLVETAKIQFLKTSKEPILDIEEAHVCTISDMRFYSYRRNKSIPYRNISYIIA